MASRSLKMQPNKSSPGSMFIKSQLCTPVPLLNPSTSPVASPSLQAPVPGSASTVARTSFHTNSHLILAVRSPKKGEDAASKLRTQYPSAKISVWTLEMSSYSSIQAFVLRVEKDLPRLDIVILNAGLVKEGFKVMESTGHEESIQVNYLSTVLLSILLLPALKQKSPPSSPGRLTIVGSGTALVAKFSNRNAIPLLKSFDNEKEWNANERYADSKLLGHYFMAKFVNYVNPKDVIVNLVDPGLCKGSGLFRDVSGIQSVVWAVVKKALGRTMEVGSTAYVDAAVVKGEESHGCFVMDWKICPFAALLYAPDGHDVTERLWDETMKELEFAGPLRILDGLETVNFQESLLRFCTLL